LQSQKDFTVTEQETDKNHIHLMIDYDPKISVSQIVRHIKQITTNNLWKQHGNYLRQFFWREKTLWADGYFVCSIGNSNPETINKYIQNQG
jgi:putative transposase